MLSPRRYSRVLCALLFAWSAGRSVAQAPNGAWVYPSATGNLLYQLDSRGQRIADFSQCGYRGGTEPLPNVSALIPQSRWVYVNPGTGDDTALIQAAIDSVEAMAPDANGWRGLVYLNAGEYQLATTITIQASGVVLKGAGDDPTTGTRLRATDARQYTLISVTGSGSRSTVSGTTRNLTQKLVPAGTRTFEVDSTSGLAVGHTVIVKRPSTANWIADIDMDLLGPGSAGGEPDDVPWTAGSKDLLFDRSITRIDGNWITVDVPLPQTFESVYGGGQIWRYTWSGRIQQVGIEDIYGFSDYVSSTDENHAWTFIRLANLQHGWVRNITAQYFGFAAVSVADGGKWLTVADSQCLDPISIIDGGRRYSFNNDGAECTLFVKNYARKGRHDFVFGSVVAGPNAFVHCTADTAYSDTGPHQRWAVGGLFDLVTVNGNEINAQNRGNYGTGHGWAGAYMAVWNCKANGFRVRNPPTARNWLVGSIGTISASAAPAGADPAGTYDSSGPTGTGKAVHPRSLYYGQLQQRMKWPDSEFREEWLGDADQHSSTGNTGETVNCDATWLSQVEALGALPASAKFDYILGSRYVACTLDFPLDPGDTIVAASLTVSLRAITNADADSIWLDSSTNPQSYASLGWTPISTTAPTVRTMEVSPALLSDGRLNLAFGTNTAVDFAVLHLQVQKAQPSTHTITLTSVADAYVQGGVNAGNNYGTASTLVTKEDSNLDLDREAFLRWDLSGVTGKLVQAKVRLAGTSAAQTGNESCATFVSIDTWSETTLTFNNKPASGKLFAQWLPVTGQPVEFTVTPQVVETLLDSAKLLSLRILSTDNYGAAGNVSYASRENSNAANRPQLILTFENTAPTISNVANQSVNEDTTTTALPMVLGDDFTAAAALTVTGTSSNLTLVPNASIVFGGSGASRTVTVTPAANQSGTATITLTASDGTLTASDTFVFTVNAVNDAPAISNLTDRSIAVNTNTGALAITVGDIETAATALTLTKSSSNPTLVPTAGIVFGGSGANRTVTVTPAANQLGTATITTTVSDGALTASDTFLLTITGTAQEMWRFANFGTTANSGNSADLADANNDGEANLLEYATAQNPNTTSRVALSAIRTASAVEVTYSRSKAALTAGVTFTVESSDTLATNSWSATGVTQAILTDNGTVQTVKATIPAGTGILARFARLKVTP